MKKLTFILAAAAILASCAKEAAPEFIKGTTYPVVFNAGSPEITSKLSLDGVSFKWAAGDQVFVRVPSAAEWDSEGKVYDILTASGAGSSVAFTGEFHYADTKNVYCFYAKGAQFIGANASQLTKTVSATQSGKLEDIQENAILWETVKAENVVKGGTEAAPTYSISGTMKPHFAIVKFNVAESLGVKQIVINGTSLAGIISISTAKTYGTIGATSSNFMQISSPASAITISRNGETISGDVYAVVLPDAFDEECEYYYNSTEALKITFTNASGSEASVSKALKNFIVNGQLKNLGSVTALDFAKPAVSGGRLCLVADNQHNQISVTDTLAGCKYYIEQQGEDGLVKDPVAGVSPYFYASLGYCLSGSEKRLTTYFKVLVHTDDPNYSDAILKGYYRQWTLYKGSDDNPSDFYTSITEHVTALSGGTGWILGPNNATYSSDGLMYKRISDSDPKITIGSSNATFYSSRLLVGPISQYNADAWVGFHVNKSGDLSGKLWVNGADAGLYTRPTSSGVSNPAVYLGARKAGDWYAFRGNASHNTTFVRLLETGDSIPVPSANL